jgi:hypothetical protein
MSNCFSDTEGDILLGCREVSATKSGQCLVQKQMAYTCIWPSCYTGSNLSRRGWGGDETED